MKKIALLFLCLLGSLTTAMEEPILGWKFTNKTGEPVTLKWYKTRVGTSITGRYTWGKKKEIPNSTYYIENNESRFVVLPDPQKGWDGYSARRELLITYDQQYLDKEIEADDNTGIIKDEAARKAIVIKNKDNLDGVEAYPQGAKDKKTIFLSRPTGTSDIKLQGVLNFDEASERIGWLLENKADKPVYCGWYQAAWNNELEMYANPTRLFGLDIITISPSKEKRFPFPKKEDEKQQRQLLLSFDKDLLSEKIATYKDGTLAPGLTARNKHDLKPFNTQWQIFDEGGAPALVAHSYLIQVNNTTNKPLYASMYYVKEKNAEAKTFGASRLKTLIMPQLSKKIQFPQDEMKGWIVNLLIADEANKDLLQKPSLTKDEISRLAKKRFGKTNLINWYMQGAYSILYDFTKPENNYLNVESIGGGGAERLARKAFDIRDFNDYEIEKFEDRFRKHDPAFEPDKTIKDVAINEVNPILTKYKYLDGEHAFVEKRTEVVRKAINKLFEDDDFIKEDDYVPKIAFVFSGGGYRAMISTIGYLRGAYKTGILDTCTYMTGLSGSTWAINPLVVSGVDPIEFSELQRYKVGRGAKERKAGKPGYLHTLTSNLIKNPSYAELRFIQSRYGQPHGLIGLYGHAIANSLLEGFSIDGKMANRITLSDMRKHLKNADKYPLPLSVAIDPGRKGEEKERVWYEFSPYYIGTFQEDGAWVNSKFFGGSIFNNNLIKHYGPEYPLGQYMGIWGSAFALNPKDAQKLNPLYGTIAKTVSGLGSGLSTLYDLVLWKKPSKSGCPGRITAGELPNPTYHSDMVPDLLNTNPSLCLVDGGITKEDKFRHNFGSVPALWRNVDILIMCDSIEKPNTDLESQHLVASDKEAHSLGLPFPSIARGTIHKDTKEAMKENVSSLFIEKNKPVVIYMKNKKNETYSKDFDPDATKTNFTSTFNFHYTPKEYDLLSGLPDHIISDETTVDNIKKAISEIVKRHSK